MAFAISARTELRDAFDAAMVRGQATAANDTTLDDAGPVHDGGDSATV